MTDKPATATPYSPVTGSDDFPILENRCEECNGTGLPPTNDFISGKAKVCGRCGGDGKAVGVFNDFGIPCGACDGTGTNPNRKLEADKGD